MPVATPHAKTASTSFGAAIACALLLAVFVLPWALALNGCGGKTSESARSARQEVRFPVETAPLGASSSTCRQVPRL